MLGFLLGRTIGRVTSVAVVAVIALGAGWFFFVRDDNSAQKEAAAVTDEVKQAANATATTVPANTSAAGPTRAATAAATAQPAAAASSIGSASYTIVQGQSSAWYLAPERLSRLPTSSVAKGTTTDVKGEFHFTPEGLNASRPTTFTVGLATMKSDEAQRDRRMHEALESSKFPTATFTATKLTGMPKEFGATDSVMQLTGMLELHGEKKEVTWELKVKKDGEILSGLGTVKFKYADFGIRKPDIAGFVTVEADVTIQVQLFAKQG